VLTAEEAGFLHSLRGPSHLNFFLVACDIVEKHPPDKYWISITTPRGEITRIDGGNVEPFFKKREPPTNY